MKKYKVLFCDLDGTLIETISGKTFPEGIWDMKFKFDVLDAIKKLNPKYIAIITNQGGIEKGFVNKIGFISKITFITDAITEYCKCDCHFNYCISNNKDNFRRKPNTRMLEEFYHDYYGSLDFNKKDALMIGDASGLKGQFSDTDKKTAENFGIDYLDVNEFIKIYNKDDRS